MGHPDSERSADATPLGFFKKARWRALAGLRGAGTLWREVIGRRQPEQAAELVAAQVPATDLGDPQVMRAMSEAPVFFRYALSAGANPNARASNQDTLLHRAVQQADLENVRALIAAGADLERRDAEHRTPLLLACDPTFARSTPSGEDRRALIARMLLEAGAQADGRDRDGRTPLALAPTFAMADVLMAGGARLFATDNDGIPAFHSAVNATDVDLGPWLAACQRHGADINRPAADGLSLTQRVLDAALNGNYSWNDTNAREGFLSDNEPSGSTERVLHLLREAGGDFSATDGYGRNVFHRRAPSWTGYAPAMVWLVRHTRGGLLRQADKEGVTPEAPVLAAMRAQTDETSQAALAVVQAVVMSADLIEASPAADAKPTRRRARL